jgi:iron(III) transport system substrate-binding protein
MWTERISARAAILPCLPLLLFTSAWGQESGAEKEWRALVEAAQKEGKVVVASSPDPEMRTQIPAAFKARFGITLEYLGGSSSLLAERLRRERRAGVYTVDVVLSGISTFASIFYPEKMLDPIYPALLLPEVLDRTKWKKGKLWFADPEERYVLKLFYSVGGSFYINTKVVRPAEFQSARVLLDPKWRGKISTEDPRIDGSGSNRAAELYRQLGESFVKQLYIDQKPAITRDRRQITDWLARGSHPISLTARDPEVERMQEEGLPVTVIFDLPDVGGRIEATRELALLNQAPHPNAARVFVNWIASREGMEAYSRAYLRASLRNDVDVSFLPAQRIPRAGVHYFDSGDWNFTVTEKDRIRARLNEMLR